MVNNELASGSLLLNFNQSGRTCARLGYLKARTLALVSSGPVNTMRSQAFLSEKLKKTDI